MTKTYDKKRDFIKIISSMTNTELNDYIKQYGSEPKPVVMCRMVDKSKKKIILNIIVSILYLIWVVHCYRKLEMENESKKDKAITVLIILILSACFIRALFID